MNIKIQFRTENVRYLINLIISCLQLMCMFENEILNVNCGCYLKMIYLN